MKSSLTLVMYIWWKESWLISGINTAFEYGGSKILLIDICGHVLALVLVMQALLKLLNGQRAYSTENLCHIILSNALS
jgi:hypothetical protein